MRTCPTNDRCLLKQVFSTTPSALRSRRRTFVALIAPSPGLPGVDTEPVSTKAKHAPPPAYRFHCPAPAPNSALPSIEARIAALDLQGQRDRLGRATRERPAPRARPHHGAGGPAGPAPPPGRTQARSSARGPARGRRAPSLGSSGVTVGRPRSPAAARALGESPGPRCWRQSPPSGSNRHDVADLGVLPHPLLDPAAGRGDGRRSQCSQSRAERAIDASEIVSLDLQADIEDR